MRLWVSASTMLCLAASGGSGVASPLPFGDGIYLSEPGLCGLSIEEMVERVGDYIHYIYHEIDGTAFNGVEARCEVKDVARRGDVIEFRASCYLEGTKSDEAIALTYVSASSFRSGTELFQRC